MAICFTKGWALGGKDILFLEVFYLDFDSKHLGGKFSTVC